MMAMIECRRCESPYCDGCNIYTLSKMLLKGELNCLMGDSHSIARTPESLRPKWISVEDRLPKNGYERVLVKIKDANNIIGSPDMDTDRYWHGRWVRWGENVTHWMPLPEPPNCGADMRGAT